MALSLKAILGLDASGYEYQLNRADRLAQNFTNKVKKSTGKAGSGIAEMLEQRIAQFASIAAGEEALRHLLNYAEEIKNVSEQLGISATAFQQWAYAATQSGSTAEKVKGFFEALAQTRDEALAGGEGGEKKLTKLARFGISKEDLKTLRLEDVALKIGDTIKAGDVQNFIGDLKDIGGKGATSLVGAFKAGLAETFTDAPIIKTKDIVDLEVIGSEFSTFFHRLMAEFAPAVSFISRALLGELDQYQARLFAAVKFAKEIASGAGMGTALNAAWDKYNELFNRTADRDKWTREAANQADSRGSSAPNIPDRDGEEKKSKREKRGLEINEWQRVGALVSLNPTRGFIEKNTIAVQENTRVLKQLPGILKKPAGKGYFGEGYMQGDFTSFPGVQYQ
jgi:hypothetical protein